MFDIGLTYLKSDGKKYPPLQLYYLATFLKNIGASVHIFDPEIDRGFDSFCRKSAYLGISFNSYTYEEAEEIKHPHKIFGGPLAEYYPYGSVDHTLVIGQGYNALSRILSVGSYDRVHRENTHIDFPVDFSWFPRKHIPLILTSTGCNSKCRFCVSGGGVVRRNEDFVNEELKNILDSDFPYFEFCDNGSPPMEYVRQIKNKKWGCFSRIGNSNIEEMIDHGMTSCSFGIESMNDEVLIEAHKGLTSTFIRNYLENILRFQGKCKFYGYLIKGLPTQTIKSHMNDVRILNNYWIEPVVNKFELIPGTYYWREHNVLQ